MNHKTKNKIKEGLTGAGAVIAILMLGLAPVAEKAVFTLKWKDFGIKMVEAGVIDQEKFESLYKDRGGLTEEDKKILLGNSNEEIKLTSENSAMMLNMLWAFGLGNKNPILEKGPMMDERYGGAGNFASTGGWNLSKGSSMDHYSMHSFVELTSEQQNLIEKVAPNIFRPCCGNPTHFPDCNHGMAMLGLLEIMASEGATEEEMYALALEVNTLWFPGQYEIIKKYFESQGLDWKASTKRIVGNEFSSSQGYQQMLSMMEPQIEKGGGGCAA